jgi:hypothetical protein
MIGTRRIQENAGALLNVLLNTLPTVHEPFIALLSYSGCSASLWQLIADHHTVPKNFVG